MKNAVNWNSCDLTLSDKFRDIRYINYSSITNDGGLMKQAYPRTRCQTIIQCLFALCLFSVSFSFAQEKKPNPGLEPYSPTRVEWTALYFQAHYGIEDWRAGAKCLARTWRAKNHDTVNCSIVINANAPPGEAHAEERYATEVFEQWKKKQGWDWLKLQIRTEIQQF
jgi:hypothetical protein